MVHHRGWIDIYHNRPTYPIINYDVAHPYNQPPGVAFYGDSRL